MKSFRWPTKYRPALRRADLFSKNTLPVLSRETPVPRLSEEGQMLLDHVLFDQMDNRKSEPSLFRLKGNKSNTFAGSKLYFCHAPGISAPAHIASHDSPIL